MSDRKNIKVPEPLFNRLKEDKGAHRSWPQYFEDQLADDDDDMDAPVDMDVLKSSLETVEKRTGKIERTLEDMGGHR